MEHWNLPFLWNATWCSTEALELQKAAQTRPKFKNFMRAQPGILFQQPWHVQRRLIAIAPPSSLATNHFEWYLHSVRWSAGRSSAVRKWRELRFLRRWKDAIPLELTRRNPGTTRRYAVHVGMNFGKLDKQPGKWTEGIQSTLVCSGKNKVLPKNGGTGTNPQWTTQLDNNLGGSLFPSHMSQSIWSQVAAHKVVSLLAREGKDVRLGNWWILKHLQGWRPRR